jgi:hypothetical protein
LIVISEPLGLEQRVKEIYEQQQRNESADCVFDIQGFLFIIGFFPLK